tara:strand:- start:1873 stop:2772 length:900 start_codon:yes stop_codon:yes gene_type:complete
MKLLDCVRMDDGKWIDETKIMEFSKYQYMWPDKDGAYNFEASTEKWITAKFKYIMDFFGNYGSGDYIFNPEIIFRKPVSYNKYNNSSILVLGGGPSTSKLLESGNLPDVDYNWSLNKFFKNEKLPKIDLAVLGKEVDMFDSTLNEYIKNNSTNIVFEEDKENLNPDFPMGMSGEQHLQKEFPMNTAFYKTRYASKLGIGSRMVLYSIFLGVDKIYTIGLDGLCLDNPDTHAFENDKSFPNWGLGYEDVYHLMKRQYIVYWEYILELQKIYNFEIINLAENYTDVSLFGKITKEWNEKYR